MSRHTPVRRRARTVVLLSALAVLLSAALGLVAARTLRGATANASDDVQDRASKVVGSGIHPGSVPTSVSTQVPTAAATSACDHAPSSCGYPDSSSTGPRTTRLQRVPEDVRSGTGWHYVGGGIIVDGRGTVLEGLRTRASVTISASDVTVRDCVLEPTGETWGIGLASGAHLTVEHNLVRGGSTDGPTRLLVGVKDLYGKVSDVSVVGNDISRTSTGIQLDAGLVQGNYVHELGSTGGDHVNGLTSNGGTEPLVVRGNTIFNQQSQTDAIGLFQDFGPQSRRWIVDNFLSGGGYTLYAGANPGREARATEIHVLGNRFSSSTFPASGSYGPVAAWHRGGGNEWRANTWDATGAVVPEP